MRGAAFLSGLSDCACRRHRRHYLRRRRAEARLPARGVRGGRHRRRAHQLPHAGRLLVRSRRRQPRPATTTPTIGPTASATSCRRRALVFGGDTLTTTDIAVAAGARPFGDRFRRRPRRRTRRRGARRITSGCSRSGRPDEDERRAGAGHRRRRWQRPDRRPAAGRLRAGQARALRGRQRDRRGDRPDRRRGRSGLSRSTSWPATPRSTQAKPRRSRRRSRPARPPARAIVDVEDVPLTYLPGNATRIRVKAVGDLELGRLRNA